MNGERRPGRICRGSGVGFAAAGLGDPTMAQLSIICCRCGEANRREFPDWSYAPGRL